MTSHFVKFGHDTAVFSAYLSALRVSAVRLFFGCGLGCAMIQAINPSLIAHPFAATNPEDPVRHRWW